MKCFYHSADLDGHCSGAIVKFFRPEAECIGINYGDPFPWDRIEPNEEVWMVDFTLQPFSDMERLNALCNLTWIDHHKTAIAEAKDRNFKASGGEDWCSTTYAGCELAWFKCHGFNGDLPKSVFFLGRYDIWKHGDHPGALDFQYGMRFQENTRPENQEFWKYIFSDHRTEELINLGRTLRIYEERRNIKVCSASAFDVIFDGLRCIAVNETMGNSLTFASVWDPEKYDAMLCFYWKRTQWTVSLFSDKPDVDVSGVCKARGGGGHTGASGFQCSTLPFLEGVKP